MTRELSFDVLVVGAGPAGLAAAANAGRSGKRVALIDMQPNPGGQIWRPERGVQTHPKALALWSACEDAGVEWLGGTTVLDADSPTQLLATGTGRTWRLRGETVVVATGARERFVPFSGWELEGVVGIGGLQALIKSGFDPTGKRIVIAGTGPLPLAVATTTIAYGGTIVARLELASRSRVATLLPTLLRNPSKLVELARLGPWPVPRFGRRVVGVKRSGAGLDVRVHGPAGEEVLECDILACGYGLVPQTRLARVLGCRVGAEGVWVDPLQRTSVPSVLCAGEPTGIGGEPLASLEGEIAGYVAGGDLEHAARLSRRRRRARAFARALDKTFALGEARQPSPETIVCRCEGTTLAQVRPFSEARVAKLQTRCGMGPCQGRVCGPGLSHTQGWSDIADLRPPLFPTPVGALMELWSEPPQCPRQ
ncbi:MAG: FAD/NAD(P)-binding oxidoreductase [Myxococcota bacterium]